MKMLLLSLVIPLTAFAHPGHQHADWITSLTHNPMVIVLSLLGVALLGARVLAYLPRRKQALSFYGKFERRSQV